MANHHEIANFIWSIADLLRGPYRPPQYERVMLPMTVLRRFDCVLAATKNKVLREYERRKGGKLGAEGLDKALNRAAGQRFHNHSPLTFEKLKGDPDHIDDVQAIDKTLGRQPQLDWNDVWRGIQALLAAVGEVGA